jgi:hypothetical protein
MAHGKEDDSLFWDILTCLAISVNARLQWSEIRDNLFKKYEKFYDKESFEPVLSRFLKRVAQSGYIKKDSVKHQEVYYFIPKGKQKEVVEKLDRRFMHQKLDEYWDKLSSEQRKKAVENVLFQGRMIVQSQKFMAKEFIRGLKDMSKSFEPQISKFLESNEYSQEQKQELKNTMEDLDKQFSKINKDAAESEKFVKESWQQFFDLTVEFTNKVVDPFYNGKYFDAIESIMKKEIEERTKKLERCRVAK